MSADNHEWMYDQAFTFIIGLEKKRALIHASLVRPEMSELFSILMNSAFKEARDREASFPDCDVETFACFVNYLYYGTYVIKSPQRPPGVYEAPYLGLLEYRCAFCSETCESRKVDVACFPYCSSRCRELRAHFRFWVACVKCGWRAAARDSGGAGLCEGCEDIQEDAFLGPVAASPAFIAFGNTFHVDENVKSASRSSAAYIDSVELIEHAKVYIFADQWFLKDLAALSLARLHTGLCMLVINTETSRHLLDLIRFPWQNTTRDEEHIEAGQAKTLRKLLLAYFYDIKHELRASDEYLRFLDLHTGFRTSMLKVDRV